SQPGVVVPPPDSSDIQDYDYDYVEENLNVSDISENLNDSTTLRFTRRLANLTKDSGETVKLRCEFSGDPPPSRYRWSKNEAPVQLQKQRVIERRYQYKSGGIMIYGTKLTIKDLEIHDKGYYKCEATNGEEKREDTGILIVKPSSWHRTNKAPESKASIPSMEDLGVHFPDLPGGTLPGSIPGGFPGAGAL
ncbi:unnamed protein product, partial [Meganyctiphanes norvegica]